MFQTPIPKKGMRWRLPWRMMSQYASCFSYFVTCLFDAPDPFSLPQSTLSEKLIWCKSHSLYEHYLVSRQEKA